MDRTREPAVAGSFYSAVPTALHADVARLLAAAVNGPAPKAVIAPHAGYVYSGPVAANALRRVKAQRVVLLGPSHFVGIRGLALPGAEAFETPMGRIPVENPPGIPEHPAAHAEEHSLEVALPLLQAALGSFTLVPLLVGEAEPEEIAEVLARLWGGPETAIVVSSDLSHYLPYHEAQRTDAATAKEILALGRVHPHHACGAAPVNGLLAAARKKRMRPELLDLRNSGDTAGGRKRVVGYGAFAFYEAAA
jgi:MEMO1 family protein